MWRRKSGTGSRTLYGIGVLTVVDRAGLAAWCQSYAHRVEADERMRETPAIIRTPSGYVQQSPWMSVASKQLELMGRCMAELGLTPASRLRPGDQHYGSSAARASAHIISTISPAGLACARDALCPAQA